MPVAIIHLFRYFIWKICAVSCAVLLGFFVLTQAHAQSQSYSLLTEGERNYVVTYPGVGLMTGLTRPLDTRGTLTILYHQMQPMEFALTLGGSVHGRGRFYGFGSGHLQIGNTSGISVINQSGYNVLPGDGFFVLGLEPLNVVFQETFDLRNGFPRDFLTWMPMVAVGPQIPMGSCRVAVVARGGFFLSDLSPTAGERQFNAGAVYGLGGYLNCDEVIDIAAAIARVHFDDRPVDVIQSEIQLPVIPAGEH
jgi:hypothetical protein